MFRSSGRTHNRHSTQTRVTSSRRPQRNTTDGETDGGLNKDGAENRTTTTEVGARPATDNRAHNPRETSAGGVSQDTRCGGAYPGEKTTTRPQRHRRNRRGSKGAEQRQPEGREQGQPGEEPPPPPPGHGGTSKPRSPWRNLPTNRGEKAGTHYQQKREAQRTRRETERASREETRSRKGGRRGEQSPQERTEETEKRKRTGWTITKRRPTDRRETAEHHRRVLRTQRTKKPETQ